MLYRLDIFWPTFNQVFFKECIFQCLNNFFFKSGLFLCSAQNWTITMCLILVGQPIPFANLLSIEVNCDRIRTFLEFSMHKIKTILIFYHWIFLSIIKHSFTVLIATFFKKGILINLHQSNGITIKSAFKYTVKKICNICSFNHKSSLIDICFLKLMFKINFLFCFLKDIWNIDFQQLLALKGYHA